MQNAAIHMKRSQEARIHQSTTSVYHILMCDDQGGKRPRPILADSRRFPQILAANKKTSHLGTVQPGLIPLVGFI